MCVVSVRPGALRLESRGAPMLWRLRFLVCAALLLPACAPAAADKIVTSARDSAGVRIVENHGAGTLGWMVEEAAMLDIGGDGEAALFQVTDAKRLRDGRIVIASAGSRELRIHGADGRLLRSLGRAGEGPGEFKSPFWVGTLRGDSIGVWDAGLGRLTVFTPAGNYARVTPSLSSLGLFPLAQGALADGRVLVAAGGSGAAMKLGTASRDTQTFVILGHDGAVADTLGRFPGTEMVMVGSPTTGLLIRPLPFGRQTVAAVRGARVYVATGDRYEIASYETGLGLRALIRADRPALGVTRRDIDDYRRTLVTLGGDAMARRREEKALDDAPYPERMAPLTGLVADADGNLWAEEARRPGDDRGSEWTVFGPDGAARGTVRLPAGLAVKQIGRDWILGVAVDEDEVEHVRLYRLTRAPR
jgi:hypothetical protein